MIVLCIRTDKPESEIYLYDGEAQINSIRWEAHRQLADTIHIKIRELLEAQHKTIKDLEKIVVFEGPGSFTGLRIGLSVANALAYGLGIPIAGTTGDEWQIDGIKATDSNEPVQPQYGREAHITAPRK